MPSQFDPRGIDYHAAAAALFVVQRLVAPPPHQRALAFALLPDRALLNERAAVESLAALPKPIACHADLADGTLLLRCERVPEVAVTAHLAYAASCGQRFETSTRLRFADDLTCRLSASGDAILVSTLVIRAFWEQYSLCVGPVAYCIDKAGWLDRWNGVRIVVSYGRASLTSARLYRIGSPPMGTTEVLGRAAEFHWSVS